MSDYFNPEGRASDDAIGVALEGGGSKSAPFALGVIAGLHQSGLLIATSSNRVKAISSVSGGSYAASFLFNRLYDRHWGADAKSGHSDWFRACVPSIYMKSYRPLGAADRFLPQRGTSTSLPTCGECDSEGDHACVSAFKPEYSFMDQVWSNPDLLLPDGDRLRRVEGNSYRELAVTGVMLLPTIATVPVQLFGRTIFRYPFNVAPTKWTYRYGLERQFGYSPTDWKSALETPGGPHEDLKARNAQRTLDKLGAMLAADGNAPSWIINASSPGGISPVDWFRVRQRDPVRMNFELTPAGYGSGIYGYAKRTPEGPMRLDTMSDGKPLSIGDATLVSGAFFDSEQVRQNGPLRMPLSLMMHGLNLEWFTEIRNFNADPTKRIVQEMLPYPFWGLTQTEDRTTPYIHLHDGGNSENTGILALLRRGYRTIVYSHGTDERDARFEAICHLKNQLELDGTYAVTSPNLDSIIAERGIPSSGIANRPGLFSNALDELCTRELTDSYSDQVTFGMEDGKGGSKLSRLVCGRLQYVDNRERHYCDEYFAWFPAFNLPRPGWPLETSAKGSSQLMEDRARLLADLYFQWPSQVVRFDVRRIAASGPVPCALCAAVEPLATIYAALPAVDFKAIARQVDTGSVKQPSSWGEYCAFDPVTRGKFKVEACRGPDNVLYARPGRTVTDQPADIPCIALAHILLNECKSEDNPRDRRPHFPQHNFIHQTWNSSYTLFAAYFDLGRDWSVRVSNAIRENAALHRSAAGQ
jgi:hypothetical protein